MGEGTSIDFEEPVVITIQCDSDGWVMQVDKLLHITLNFEDVLVTKMMWTTGVGVVAKVDKVAPQVNEDLAFPHYLHQVDHTMVNIQAMIV